MNNGESSFVGDLYFSSNIAKNFPEINDIAKEIAGVSVVYSGMSAMGSDSVMDLAMSKVASELNYSYTIYYNDTAYLLSNFSFESAPILFVDEVTPDDKLIEAAKARIEEYINNDKIKVVIDDITATFAEDKLEELYNSLDGYLEAIGSDKTHDENTRVYSLKIGATVSPKNLFIIKTSKNNIKALELQSIEKTTGVRFTTTTSLPLDSELEVSDVTAIYKKLNDKIEQAYDINIKHNTTYVKSVAGGLKIYIPVKNNFNADGKVVAYIGEDGKVKETFDITLETVNGQKYATFTTTHLSIYGIVDGAVANPKTGDDVMLYVTSLGISVLALTVAIYTKKKRVN